MFLVSASVSLWSALRVWGRLAGWRAVAQVVGVALVLCLGCVAGGYGLAQLGRPQFEDVRGGSSTIYTREVEVTKVVTKTVVKWRTKNVYIQKFDPQTGRLVYTLSNQSSAGDTTTRKSDVTERESDRGTSTAYSEHVVKASDPRLHIFLEAAPYLDTYSRVLNISVSTGFTYDLVHLGPFGLYAGAQVVVPVVPTILPPAIILPVGVSLEH